MSDSIEKFLGWRLADIRNELEGWRFEYSFSQQLLNLTDSELDDRYCALCKNIFFLVTDARDKIPIQAQVHSTWWWLRKYTQMGIEYEKRSRPTPSLATLLSPAPPHSPPFKRASPYDYKILVRYGEAKWLVALAERGQIRFTPASSYKNEVATARKDDELNQTTLIRGDQVTVTDKTGRRIPIIGYLKTTVTTTADLYVFCVGSEFESRLLSEFPNKDGLPAEAYCVIWDVQQFNQRLLAGTERYFSRWTFHHLPIAYFDPYENGKNHISAGASKRFEYAYQQEYRFIWLPPFPGTFESPVDFEIGPLTDIVTIFDSEGRIIAGDTKRFAA